MLTALKIQHFRNLSNIDIQLSSKFNIFFGENGSGKTSLLEAVHYLGLCRSPRTHLNTRIIQHDQSFFSVYGLIEENNLSIPLGVQKKQQQEMEIKINGKKGENLLELAKVLPLQFIDGDTHQFFLEGSKPRRQFLDWGVFHVEQKFLLAWKMATQALKQRNAAIKSRMDWKQILVWEKQLIFAAEELNVYRKEYLRLFEIEFKKICEVLMPNYEISLDYYQGWPSDQDLNEAFAETRSRDVELGYTQYGPQRADIRLKVGNTPIADLLSQGQQKLVTYALRLTQGILLEKLANRRCIYLIDDLPSELDERKQFLVVEILEKLNAQIFVTGIHQAELFNLFKNFSDTKMFYVERGKVDEIREGG